MRRIYAGILILFLMLSLMSGCEKDNREELIIFAAASLTEALTELGDRYMEAHPDTELVFNFDSSGTLKTQIQEGAVCDIFISAGQKQMDQLDLIFEDSRKDILENKIVLVVSENAVDSISSFDDLCDALMEGSIFLAMGNSDVPAGQYAQSILAYYGLSEEVLATNGLITYGSNVKEIITQVKENSVSCGIVYATDADSAGLTVVDTASSEMCGQVLYPAAILENSEKIGLAEDFLSYICSSEGAEIFSAVGFTPIFD